MRPWPYFSLKAAQDADYGVPSDNEAEEDHNNTVSN